MTLKPGLFITSGMGWEMGLPSLLGCVREELLHRITTGKFLAPSLSSSAQIRSFEDTLILFLCFKDVNFAGVFFFLGRCFQKAYSWSSCNPYLSLQAQRALVHMQLCLCQSSTVLNTMGAGCFWRLGLDWSASQRMKLVHNMMAPARSTRSPAQPVFCYPASPRSEGVVTADAVEPAELRKPCREWVLWNALVSLLHR